MYILVFSEELFFFGSLFLHIGRIWFTYFVEKFRLRKMSSLWRKWLFLRICIDSFSLSDMKTLISPLDYQRHPDCFLIPLSFMISVLSDVWFLFLQGVGKMGLVSTRPKPLESRNHFSFTFITPKPRTVPDTT